MSARTQKEALHESIHRSTLPAKAIADRVGLKYSTLCHSADEGSDTQFPFRRLPALIAACDNRALLDYWESIAHRVAFDLPTGDVVGTDAQQELLAAMDALGETVKTDRRARADRIITAAEKRRCVDAARRVKQAVLRYIASLEDEVNG